VELAEKELGGLEGKTVLVIGAGEMGTLVAKALANKDIKVIYVANRTFEKAQSLACELNGTALPYEKMEKYIRIGCCDKCNKAPHFVLTTEMMSGIMGEKRISC